MGHRATESSDCRLITFFFKVRRSCIESVQILKIALIAVHVISIVALSVTNNNSKIFLSNDSMTLWLCECDSKTKHKCVIWILTSRI